MTRLGDRISRKLGYRLCAKHGWVWCGHRRITCPICALYGKIRVTR